jgi:hypothetical protein
MSVATACPYCGGVNGQHRWSSAGECPGRSTHPSEYNRPDPAFQSELTIVLQHLDALVSRLDRIEINVSLIKSTLLQCEGFDRKNLK